MNLKPWREVAVPHPDVLEGSFQQAEFAADITAVRTGKAGREYGEAAAFYQRTYITEGMRLLLTQVAQRLNARGGEPVIQLQTAFGGGKTHTLLAVYHLASRKGSVQELPGIPDLLDRAGLMDLPPSRIAVLDGTDLAPGQARKQGQVSVHTLWGELAWQLGGEEAYGLVAEADQNGTSPGKEVLKTLLERHSPCVVLIDELVAYIRQFPDGGRLSGGTYDTNLSFIQSLTEAVKLVPSAVLLASLPESEVEAGSQRGIAALRAMEKTFGRVQALWKPVATEEAFEIVRRRLFEPDFRDPKMREQVCRAFADAYIAEGARVPSETQESRYYERLLQAYPIHPEVFDRLYEDWTTIDGFQRTRGVLKLMAKVIYRLWKDGNNDLLLLPGSLPLYDGNSRNELTYHLTPGWDAVIDRDIDGERAESTELESKEPRFGALQAARRVSRTIFLATAPSSVSASGQTRGVDRARILLGCLQPGQTTSVYGDALNRIVDRAHYLNTSGDKAHDNARFWFDTRANLRREMEDRKGRFDDRSDVRGRIAEVLKGLVKGVTCFDGVHIFVPHSDVGDDSQLRLVVLPPENAYTREETRFAFDPVHTYLKQHGTTPRQRANRLLFLAPDYATVTRLKDSVRTALAWKSIVDDIAASRLVVDMPRIAQAKAELETANGVVEKVARECYKWLLCPVQETPTDPTVIIEAHPLNPSAQALGKELERVCTENELVVPVWSPIHLRSNLRSIYWKPERPHVAAEDFWEDTQRYLFLPRLKNRDVLSQAITKGAASDDFFGTAYGRSDDHYEGFQFGTGNVQVDKTLLLIDPEVAKAYREKRLAKDEEETPVTAIPAGSGASGGLAPSPDKKPAGVAVIAGGGEGTIPFPTPPACHDFHGSVEINAALAKMKLAELAEEIIAVLSTDPNASVKVTVEIAAAFPNGVPDHIRRAVSENTNQLKFKHAEWF
jgi:predicted AAA+ superfamily ATPase